MRPAHKPASVYPNGIGNHHLKAMIMKFDYSYHVRITHPGLNELARSRLQRALEIWCGLGDDAIMEYREEIENHGIGNFGAPKSIVVVYCHIWLP